MAEPLNFDIDLFRQRLMVLQRLERSLAASEAAILAMDAVHLESQAEEQRDLCREWQSLDEKIRAEHSLPDPLTPARDACWAGRTLPALERWEALRREMGRVESELRQRTRVHAALLRRMRRSLVWLETLVRDPAKTYSAPAEIME